MRPVSIQIWRGNSAALDQLIEVVGVLPLVLDRIANVNVGILRVWATAFHQAERFDHARTKVSRRSSRSRCVLGTVDRQQRHTFEVIQLRLFDRRFGELTRGFHVLQEFGVVALLELLGIANGPNQVRCLDPLNSPAATASLNAALACSRILSRSKDLPWSAAGLSKTCRSWRSLDRER